MHICKGELLAGTERHRSVAGGGGRESEHGPALSPTTGWRMAVDSLGMSVLLPGMMVNNPQKIHSPEEFARDVVHGHKQNSQATQTKALLVLNGQDSGATGDLLELLLAKHEL